MTTTNLERLKHIQKAKPPICCGRPMVVRFLNFGPLTDDQLETLSQTDFARYLADNSPIPPVFSCDHCNAESDIGGLDWPAPTHDGASRDNDLGSLRGEVLLTCSSGTPGGKPSVVVECQTLDVAHQVHRILIELLKG